MNSKKSTHVSEAKMNIVRELSELIKNKKSGKTSFKGIKKEKRIVQFPFPIVLSSKLIGILPG